MSRQAAATSVKSGGPVARPKRLIRVRFGIDTGEAVSFCLQIAKRVFRLAMDERRAALGDPMLLVLRTGGVGL